MDLRAEFPHEGVRGVIVGNTQAMWPRFVAALRREPERVEDEHPLERWLEETIRAEFPEGTIRFAHEAPWIPIQRLAEQAGLAWLSPAHLAVHPVYGPWISLRALVVLPGPPPPAPAPAPRCPGCETGCIPAFARAQTSEDWREWLAARDACPTGREHRFEEDHIAYGYTKDRAILRRLVKG